MIPELGQLCLVLAFLVSLLQGGAPLMQRLHRPHTLLHLTKPMALAVFLLISGAFAALIASYILSDFTVLTVIENSHTSKPMIYKIVGAWGNHEGSMLLWMWVLAACSFLVAFLRGQDTELKGMTLAVIGMLSAGFLGFIIFTSNPFIRVWPAPANGEDLNPILQDIGLAFHPPTLYVGYVGFAIVFAYAIAGLRLKRLNADWARTVHPWILMPWSFLTLGIAAGSWWAYRELGWGGWWFWDPVENVSLLPWLVGTALFHSNLVLERRGQLARWVALLAILAFTMSLIGTFIVRSGLITSVHAFASDPTRGMFILGYIAVVSGGGLLVYGLSQTPGTKPVTLLSRSGFILINNLLLLAGAGVILVAILYPLGLELAGLPSVSVGPPYFNATFLPMTAALPLLAALAPLMAWDSITPVQLRTLMITLAPALAVALFIALALITPFSALALAGLALGLWLMLGTWKYFHRMRRAQVRLFSDAGLRTVASAAAHTGLAMFVIGMALSATLKQTYEMPLSTSEPMQMGPYTLRLVGAEKQEQHNYTTRKANLDISRDGQIIATLSPELRYFSVRAMQTAEAALYSTPLRDIYVVLGESNYSADKEKITLGVRLYINPMQQWVWAGFLMAAAGGMLALLVALRRVTRRNA